MTKKGLMAEDQLIVKAIALPREALGPVETRRFLALPKAKRMESVKRHRLWQSSLTKAEFFDRIFDT